MHFERQVPSVMGRHALRNRGDQVGARDHGCDREETRLPKRHFPDKPVGGQCLVDRGGVHCPVPHQRLHVLHLDVAIKRKIAAGQRGVAPARDANKTFSEQRRLDQPVRRVRKIADR